MSIKWPGEISPTSVFQDMESHLWLSLAFQQDPWLQWSLNIQSTLLTETLIKTLAKLEAEFTGQLPFYYIPTN